MTGEEQRKAWLETVRGAAAVSVALYHFNVEVSSGSNLWRDLLAGGYFRVPIFFVLSGWGVTTAWLHSTGWRDFGHRRLRRILPPYYASLLLVLAFAALTKLLFGHNDIIYLPSRVSEIFAALTLTTTPVTSLPPMNWVYWSLSVILTFYLVLTLLQVIPGREQRLGALAFVHLILCAAAFWCTQTGRELFYLLPHWPIFGVGVGLALTRVSPLWSTVMLSVSALHIALLYFGSHPTGPITVAVGTVILILVAGRLPFPALLSPIRYLGVISYSIYLVHVPAGRFLSHHILPDMRTVSNGRLIATQMVGLIAVLVIAWIFHRLCAPMVRVPARVPLT